MDIDYLHKLVVAARDEETDGPAFDALLEYLREVEPGVSLLRAVQRESSDVNEAHGVIAYFVGVVARIQKSKTLDEAHTIAEMASTVTDEWRAGIWKPGPHDDAADYLKGETP